MLPHFSASHLYISLTFRYIASSFLQPTLHPSHVAGQGMGKGAEIHDCLEQARQHGCGQGEKVGNNVATLNVCACVGVWVCVCVAVLALLWQVVVHFLVLIFLSFSTFFSITLKK